MDDSLIFFTGFFCFALAIVGAVMTVVEFICFINNSFIPIL